MQSLHLFLIVVLSWCFTLAATVGAEPEPLEPGDAPLAVPTFHCIGLYWSPESGNADRKVLIRYRPSGTSSWNEGLPMRYNPIPGTDEDLADYRGSIVHLQPDCRYEIELTLENTTDTVRLTANTWSEDFPVGETVEIADGNQPIEITESGSPGAYRVYDGRGATIDVGHRYDHCLKIDASHVIIRNLILRGAGNASAMKAKTAHAVVIEGGHDIVIERCDISDWGRLDPKTGFGRNMESAIASRCSTLERLVIQRCKLHHPTCDGSNWYEPEYPTHSKGPQCISLFNTAGNHVIRYNECWSDMEHMYNDIIGGGSNGSFEGSPGPDSDIYGNYISHCWDDGLEVEGGSRNVRVWDNYITQCMMMIGNAADSIGPLYIWRNVAARSQWKPDSKGGYFLKMGFAGGERWMTGHMYIFHNTIYACDEYLPTGALGGNRIVKHVVSRNNIFQLHSDDNRCVSSHEHNIDNDCDYDLTNGRFPEGQEENAVIGLPVYIEESGLDRATMTGRFQLIDESPGAGDGIPLPNFSGQYEGDRPDIGAHQRGEPSIRYGVRAGL